MTYEFYVTIVANNSLSVSPIRFRLLKSASQSDIAGYLIDRRPISLLRRSFPQTMGYRLVLERSR
jgi:hypothetical protein